MKLNKRIHFITLLVIFVNAFGSQLLLGSNKQNNYVNKDFSEIKVAFYSVQSKKMDVIFYSLLDSIKNHWNCTPKFLALGLNAENKNVTLGSNNLLIYTLQIMDLPDTLLAFKKDGITVFCQQIKETSIPFFDSISFTETKSLKELIENYKVTECNTVKCNNRTFPLLYTTRYILKDDTVELEFYKELIDFGDFFLGREKKLERFRKKCPLIDRYISSDSFK